MNVNFYRCPGVPGPPIPRLLVIVSVWCFVLFFFSIWPTYRSNSGNAFDAKRKKKKKWGWPTIQGYWIRVFSRREDLSLQSSSPGRSGGRAGKGERAYKFLEFEFHLQFPCGSPSTELSDFHQSTRSRNERKCKQTLKNTWQRVMTSLLMSSLPIGTLHRLFWCR